VIGQPPSHPLRSRFSPLPKKSDREALCAQPKNPPSPLPENSCFYSNQSLLVSVLSVTPSNPLPAPLERLHVATRPFFKLKAPTRY
jgi:hypothetical protein